MRQTHSDQANRAVFARLMAQESVSGWSMLLALVGYAILKRLDAAAERGSEFAAKTAAGMRAKSPTSLSLAFEQVRRGAAMDFEDAMRTEFRVVSRIGDGHDFHEGVRAVLIDKDNRPTWQPASLESVEKAAIERHFAGLGDRELEIA